MLKNLRVVFLLAFFSTAIFAEETDRSMAVSISPLSLIIGSGDALFQYNLNSFMTLAVPVNFAYYWPMSKAVDWMSSKRSKIEVTSAPIGLAGGLGLRFYPTGKGMTSGFYLEPRAQIDYFQFAATSDSLGTFGWKRTSIVPKIKLGWDWFSDSGFYSNFGGGIGYSYDLKTELTLPPELKDNVKRFGSLSPLLPNTDGKGRFVWDLEFKLGFAW